MKKMICIILAVLTGFVAGSAVSEGEREVFIFCNPKTPVMIRETPKKGAPETGRLDFGDYVWTDGIKKNGFLHVLGVTEAGEGWIFSGYITEDQPEKLENARAYIAATGRVMSYRWINGRKNGWLNVCDEVKVFALSNEWAYTNKGYIRTKYLEVWYE